MKRIHRPISNEASGAYGVLSAMPGHGGRGGKPASARNPGTPKAAFAVRAMAASLLMAFGADLHALPVGGVVAAGNAAIATGAGGVTVTQGSQYAVLNWRNFDIAQGEAVRFEQPGSNAVALNRVLGPDPSAIFGSLSANGKVFLVNPNGILFGPGASVNVGGLVASTLDIADGDLMAGRFHFAGQGGGTVVNQGSLTAAGADRAEGGYVALLGAHVSNQGVIAARLGTVALAAGSAFTLDVAGDGLLRVAVEQGALQALVGNGGLIQADGGNVLLSAQAAGKLLHTVVNNTGVIQAQTVDSRSGSIRLLGDMDSGTVNVGGTLDASAPAGGNGGFIDTSAATVAVSGAFQVSTLAAQGTTGTWLIDPYDITISNGNGGAFTAGANDSIVNAAALQTALATTNVEVSTGAGGAQAGNITVAAPLAWSAPTTLALTAAGGIAINAPISITGAGGLALTATAQAGVTTTGLTFGNGASADYGATDHGGTFSLNGKAYKMIYTMAQFDAIDGLSAVDGSALTGYGAGLGGDYALATSLNASGTVYTRALAGTNTGNAATRFTGRFDGLGHTIAGLAISGTATSVGLFGAVNTTVANGPASVSNIGLVGGSVAGNQFVGALVGRNYGNSIVQTSYAATAVSGAASTGGLVGRNDGTIQASYATGAVTGSSKTGGLTGYNQGGLVQASYATGAVAGGAETGGLAGQNDAGASIKSSYAGGAVSATGPNAGGLVGYSTAAIQNSYATGAVASTNANGIGGLLGWNFGGTVSASFWNSQSSGKAVGIGTDNNSQSGNIKGMTTAQMQAQANFTSATAANGNLAMAWDFAGTWTQYEGHGAPLLRAFLTPLTVTASNAAKTYDGQAYAGNGGVAYSLTPDLGKLQGTLSYGGSAQGAVNAGSYAITADGLFSTSQQGYLISYAGGALTIGKASLSIGTSNVVKTYDGTVNAAGSAIVTGGTLFGTDAIGGGTFAYSDKNAGTGNKTVSASAVDVSDGNGGGNYDVSYVANTTSTINPYAVNLSGSRVYDGSASTAAGMFSTGALVGAETLVLSGSGSVTSGAVGDGKAVALGSLTLGDGNGGGLAANYTLAGGTHTANITPAIISITGLTVTGESAYDKVYDGTTAAIIDASMAVLHGVIAGDEVLLVTGGVTGSFADKNVGANKDVTVTGNAITGASAANYTVGNPSGLTASITRAPLSIGSANVTKTYDGNVSAAGSAVAAKGTLFGSDSLDGGAFAYTDKNAGAGNKTVTASGVTVNDGNGGRNYEVSYVANTTSTINPYAVSLAGSRAYNGTTSAAAGIFTIGPLVGAETLGLSGSGTVAVRDAGDGKAVALGSLALNDGSGGGLAANYTLAGGAHTVNITPASLGITGLTVSGERANDKVYDGTTAATIDTGSAVLNGVIAGDEVQLVSGGVTGSFADKHVGVNKHVTVTGNAITGASAANYTVANPTGLTASITRAPLSIGSGDVVKTYDGTVNAIGSASVAGGTLFGTDAIGGGTFAYNDKNAGAGTKTVIASGITVSDGNGGGNYDVSYVANTTSTINPYIVSLNGSRVYDGTASAAAAIFGMGALVGAETLALSGSGTVANANAGNGKAVAPGTLALNDGGSGGLAANYTLAGGTHTASFTQAALTLAGSRSYDGTGAMGGGVLRATGVRGETFTVTGQGDAGNLASANVQTGSLASTAGLALGASANGGLAANYLPLGTAGSAVAITRAGLVLDSGNVVKTYDGTLSAAGSATVAGGTLFGTDALGGGTFAYTDKNAGAGNKTVTTSGVTVSDGNGGGNYDVSYAANTASTIIPYAVSLDGTRVYDGTANAAAGIFRIGALVGAETLALSGSGTVASGNAGGGKAVALGSLALNDGASGGLAANYTLGGGTRTATITPASLTVSGESVNGRAYDGTRVAVVDTSRAVLVGVIGADQVGLVTAGVSASFADRNAGTGKAVTVAGNAIAGAAAANYTLADPAGLTATITPAILTASAIGQTKMFGTDDPLLAYTVSGLAAGDAPGTAVSGSLLRDPGQSGGLYAISQGTLASADPNYSLIFVPAAFRITPTEQQAAALQAASQAPSQVASQMANENSNSTSNSTPARARYANFADGGGRQVPAITIVGGGMQMPDELTAP